MKTSALFPRRLCLLLIAGMSLAAAAQNSAREPASAYPSRTVRIVVPLSAGGPTDLLARIIAQPLAKRLGQAVVIDNKPGAGGNIGADAVAKSPADGYTLFLGTSGPLSINPSLYAKLPFDPAKDFTPIVAIASAPFVVAVNPKVQARTLTELVQLAKREPNKLNAGSVTGSAAHLATELFKNAAGLEITHIPYKGAAPATNDLVAGQIELSFASTPGVVPQIRAGTLRALAVTSPRRIPQLPDVPTVAETLPGFDASVWYGLVAPTHTPPEIVQRLNREVMAILQDPQIREQMAGSDFTPTGSTPEQFGRFIEAEAAKWSAIVKAKGIRAE
jgi:tripartite-type tricarboxylate transporter receptor subunit TctC